MKPLFKDSIRRLSELFSQRPSRAAVLICAARSIECPPVDRNRVMDPTVARRLFYPNFLPETRPSGMKLLTPRGENPGLTLLNNINENSHS